MAEKKKSQTHSSIGFSKVTIAKMNQLVEEIESTMEFGKASRQLVVDRLLDNEMKSRGITFVPPVIEAANKKG